MKSRTLTPNLISLPLSPMQVAEQLRHLDGFVFFDSVGNFPSNSKTVYSVFAARPVKVVKGGLEQLDVLRKELQAFEVKQGEMGFPLGGLCGWLDYDGSYCFGVYPEMLVYDHQLEEWWEVGGLSSSLADMGKEGDRSQRESVMIGEFHSNTSRADYLERVRRAQEYIGAGDIYQVNISQRYEATIQGGSLFELYSALRDSSPAPMAAWMSLGGREILSSSPETFLKIQGKNIETKPIKGTRPRYKKEKEDLASAKELESSEKEVAELVMITDLERNDLGKICYYGSVEVPEMIQLERLEHVYHLVSTVRGVLKDDVDHLSALKECFPGGSITGAPKKRAMEVIEELEGAERGLYTGAVGYIGFNGCSQFSIVIRTLVREGESLVYNVGAGIVADSDADAEYEETLHKARGVRLAIKSFIAQNGC